MNSLSQNFNLANFLSFMRILLTPFFIWFLFKGGVWLILSVFVFTVAAFTDLFDGHCARRYGLSSRLGSFLDPLADKILICGVLISFYFLGIAPLWLLFLLIIRDVFITGLRMLMINGGQTLATSYLGKVKTTLLFIMIFLMFLFELFENYPALKFMNFVLGPVVVAMIYIVSITVFYSAVDYFWKNREFLKSPF
jgi:CDP-diacylglycerol---glycerol-3-phosphate 3-phosphatidyltransferase